MIYIKFSKKILAAVLAALMAVSMMPLRHLQRRKQFFHLILKTKHFLQVGLIPTGKLARVMLIQKTRLLPIAVIIT